MKTLCVCILVLLAAGSQGLDNGLGLVPAMGWLSWQRYRCNTDCKNFPDECISEKLYQRMADKLVEDGYRDLGYVHVNIDDCWSLRARDAKTNKIVADPTRFPSGIPALADYMHKRGLKLGIYGDAGLLTCAGYPGSQKFVELDAQTFADWNVDMLKFDGCFIDENDIGGVYTAMTAALNKTGKKILYSCEWPLYLHNLKPDYEKIAAACNLWRNYNDVDDNWDSIKSIIDFYVKNQDMYTPVAKPGAFFDPDMLVTGDYGLSEDQAKVQMSLWAIWASPLFISADLYNMKPEFKNILQNKYVIGVSQDKMGMMGSRYSMVGDIHIFHRMVLPSNGTSHSVAVAFVNRAEGGGPTTVTLNAAQVGLKDSRGYLLTDLYNDNKIVQKFDPSKDNITVTVNPSGVNFWKATLCGAQ